MKKLSIIISIAVSLMCITASYAITIGTDPGSAPSLAQAYTKAEVDALLAFYEAKADMAADVPANETDSVFIAALPISAANGGFGGNVSAEEGHPYITSGSWGFKLDNFSSSVDPAVTDDISEGYSMGSLWYNTADFILWVCLDPTEDAAVWGKAGLVADTDYLIPSTVASTYEAQADMPTDVPANETDPNASVHPWVTATAYAQNVLVSNSGVIYKCIVAHTAGTDNDEPGVGASWQTYWEAGGTGFDPANPGEIGATTPGVVNASQVNVNRSTTAGDKWCFREGSNNGDNQTCIQGADSQSYNNSIVLPNKEGDTALGPPHIAAVQTSDYNAAGQFAQNDIIPFSGTNTAINLDPVSGLSANSVITIHSLDAEDKTINPNANDKICYNSSGTWACLDDGDAISLTDVGYLTLYRMQNGTGWGVLYSSIALSDAGAGCSGWNCGIGSDANVMAWYKFDDGALTADSKGSYTLTSHGTPVADTVNFIQGDASVDLESDDLDYFSVSGTADDFGWASSNALSITGWIKAESSPSTKAIFIKDGTKHVIRIGYTTTSYISLAVDGNDDGNWETNPYGTPCTDGQWYFFAVTVNVSTGGYTMYIWDQTAGATLGSPVSSTLASGIANINSTDDWYIGLYSGANFDGLIDDMTFWDKQLNQTEIDQIRAGTYGQ